MFIKGSCIDFLFHLNWHVNRNFLSQTVRKILLFEFRSLLVNSNLSCVDIHVRVPTLLEFLKLEQEGIVSVQSHKNVKMGFRIKCSSNNLLTHLGIKMDAGASSFACVFGSDKQQPNHRWSWKWKRTDWQARWIALADEKTNYDKITMLQTRIDRKATNLWLFFDHYYLVLMGHQWRKEWFNMVCKNCLFWQILVWKEVSVIYRLWKAKN